MNLSMTGQEKGELLMQVWLNRGDRMDRFDLIEETTWAGLT
jgi:hypothetical protein